MRVLHLIPGLGVGGTEKILFEICRGLIPRGIEPQVLALKAGGQTEQELKRIGVPVETLDTPDSFLAGALDVPRLFFSLKEKIRKINPDILHTWLSRANVMGRLAAGSSGILPVISSLRVMEKEKRYHLWAERFTERFCRAVTVNSTPLKDFAVHTIGIPERKVKLILNGIGPMNMNMKRKASGNPGKEGPILGTMGRLHRQKGIDIFLRAVPMMQQKAPNAVFRIAGEGPEEKNLKALAKSLKLDRVEFVGLADSPKFLSGLDAFVLASRWEGMPNVVMEAMAMGVPVACSSVGGALDLIDHGVDGLLFRPEDPAACANAALRLVRERDLTSKMTQAAKSKIESKFSLEQMIRQYEALYGQVFSGS